MCAWCCLGPARLVHLMVFAEKNKTRVFNVYVWVMRLETDFLIAVDQRLRHRGQTLKPTFLTRRSLTSLSDNLAMEISTRANQELPSTL